MKWNTPHFLTGVELNHGELEDTLALADQLRIEREKGEQRNTLEGKHVALVFEKPSLRTRASFTVAVQDLGGKVIELESAQRKNEEPEDTIRVLQGYAHAVMIRTFAHTNLERMAKVSKVPLINGLCDLHHPCQVLADLLTLKQEFGSLQGRKVAYVGDGNNMLHSLLLLAPFLGLELAYACPKGFEPSSFIVKQAKVRAKEGGGKVSAYTDPKSAVANADAVYTDVWTSMGFEKQQAERDKVFAPYQLNEKLYAQAKDGALVMHCMPVVRGKEITDGMIEHPRSVLYRQSENRLHAQKAVLLGLMES